MNVSPLRNEDLTSISRFSENRVPFKSKRKFGYLNEKGDEAISPEYKSVGYFVGGFAWVKPSNGLVGFVDPDGEWLIEPRFSVAYDPDIVSGLARVKLDGKWLYVNKKGEYIRLAGAEIYKNFEGGFAMGRKDYKYGFYNAKGEWAISAKFDGVRPFRNGIAAAKKGGLWGFIDQKGDWVLEPQYLAVKDFELVE